MIKIEVIYIAADQTINHFYCHLPNRATVEDALNQSGILTQCPEINDLPVGIFSKRVERTTLLKEGDRLEIYRPLTIDPKERRRERAKKR